MISDVLAQAVEELKRYANELERVYFDARDIEILLSVMTAYRLILDALPPLDHGGDPQYVEYANAVDELVSSFRRLDVEEIQRGCARLLEAADDARPKTESP